MATTNINGCTISYDEQGGGVPVVLLHGFPLDRRVWSHVMVDLARDARVIAPDLRGFGQSKHDRPFSLEKLADDVHDLLLALRVGPAVVVGLSMGGYVALEFVKKYPAMLRGLVLVDTKAEADTAQGKAARDAMIELAGAKGAAAVAEQMMPKMLPSRRVTAKDAVYQELLQIMQACPAKTIQHASAAMRDRIDHRSDIPSIPVPTLLIVGKEDQITPPAVAQSMHEQIPRSKLVIIDDAGHMSPLEAPMQVASAIREFMSQAPKG